MKSIIISLTLISLSFGFFAQDFQVPKNYKLEKAEDYAPYEQDVIAAFDWLMDTPINEQAKLRKETSTFLITWLTGSPNVTISLNINVISFMETTPDLLVIFMGGWAKYSLESKDFDNKIAGNIAGVEAVIEFYTKNKDSLKKDKHVEKYIKMKKKGTLKDYIEKNT